MRTKSALLLVILLASCGLNFVALAEFIPRTWDAGDLRIFRTAAQMVRQGEAYRLYDLDCQFDVQHSLYPVATQVRSQLLPFNHPAFEALPYLLFTGLSTRTAYVSVMAVNALALAISCLLMEMQAPELRRRWLPATVWVLAFFPWMPALLLGQDSAQLLLLFTASYALGQRKQLAWSGVLLGLACFKFQITLPLAMMVLLTQRRNGAMVWGFLASISACFVTWIAMMGWAGITSYRELTVDLQRNEPGLFNPLTMPNLRGLFGSALHGLAPIDTLFLVVVGGSALVFLFGLWVSWRSEAADPRLRFAFQLAIAVLVSFHFYPYDFLIFSVAIVLTMESLCLPDYTGAWLRLGSACLALLCISLVHTVMLAAHAYFLLALIVFVFAMATCAAMMRMASVPVGESPSIS